MADTCLVLVVAAVEVPSGSKSVALRSVELVPLAHETSVPLFNDHSSSFAVKKKSVATPSEARACEERSDEGTIPPDFGRSPREDRTLPAKGLAPSLR